ncbi:MAG TPA: SusC/RagA family TonB-linked outer membrane protein, partial [Sphingobacteriaceae bacterium]
QKRKDLTGSVSSVSEKDFADMPVARLDQALTGRVAGLDILSTGGRPGDVSSILLRGKRSFTASNDPLIILDGMPFYGSMNDINPYDVKSIDVLKDASSTAIYGSRGANGVIIITSKRGASGKPTFKVESYGGPQMRYGRLPFADAQQYAEWGREAFRAQPGGYPYPDQNDEYDAIIFDAIELKTVQSGGKGLDLQDLLLQDGMVQKHQLTVGGGSENVKYNFSGNFFEQEGILPGDIFDRMSLRTNLDFTLSKIITAGTSIQLNHTANRMKSNPSALGYAFNGNPLGQVYEEDGVTPRFALTTDGFEINPLADYKWDSFRRDNKSWSAFINTYGEVKILPELTYRLSLGTNFKLATAKESSGYYSIARNLGLPTASVSDNIDNFLIYESTLTYNKIFRDKHQLTITGINGYQSTRNESSGAGVSDLPYEVSRYQNLGSANTVSAVNSNLSQWNLASFAGRIFYGFNSKYLLTLSMRADGASQFATGHKWGYFPSVAAAYRISQEKWMEPTASWLSELKFRLSYGVTGNQAINPYQTQGALARTTYSWNENAAFGYRPAALANKNLKWESTAVYNAGLDFSLFNGRISSNLEYYNTDTYDLLMFRKLPITGGYDEVLENIGRTNNKGFEAGIQTVNINRPGFRWNSSLSAYTNHTRIVELYNGKSDDIGNGWFIGQPINVYYDYNKIGIWQTNEAAEAKKYGRDVGQIKVQDLNNDSKISAEDRMILGDREPDFVASLTNQFSLKNWDFSFTTYIRSGGMTSVGAFAPYAKKRYNKFIFDYWTPNNPTNAYPRPNQLYEGSGLDGSTLTYRDASMVSVPNLTIGYTVPPKVLSKVRLSNARVYFSGENVMYWTASEMRKFNMKPDWSGDAQTYPALRTLVMGVNIGF